MQIFQFSVMNVDYLSLTALRLLESFAFASILFVYDGTGAKVTIGSCLYFFMCMEAPSARERFVTQKSAEKRKPKSPHRS